MRPHPPAWRRGGERAGVGGIRLLDPAFDRERVGQAHERGPGAGIVREPVAVVRHRLVVPAERAQDPAQVGFGIAMAGRTRERGPVAGGRLLQPARRLVDGAEVEVGVGVVRPERERAAEQPARLLDRPPLLQHHGQVVEGRHVPGARAQDAPVERLGAREVMRLLAPDATIEQLLVARHRRRR